MTSIQVHIVETLTGRITDTIPVTGIRWADVLNQPGSIDSVTVPEEVIRATDLRNRTPGMRTSLAVEVDGRMKQAGPITSRGYDWEKGQAAFGAKGLWGYFDQRTVRPAIVVFPFQANVFTVADKSLGGIARALVERAIGDPHCNVPVVLPADEDGDHTESWRLWSLANVGEQLRQITQRATDAPDIRFAPRRRGDDPRFIEWVLQVGTEAAPALSQAGPDWVFDASAPKSPVLGITTDEDPTVMAQQAWVTGNGMEEDILMSFFADSTLNAQGWPMTEVVESRPTVEVQDTLNEHVVNLLNRVNRPVEVFKVTVQAHAANEVRAGDYCRLITKAPARQQDGSWTAGDSWSGTMDRRMRVREVSGDLSDRVTLSMFPLQATL